MKSSLKKKRVTGDSKASQSIPHKTIQAKNKDLPETLNSNLEHSFGFDFSKVKILRNSKEAQEMNARAYTQAEQIHFAPGEFNPNTESGRNLIGHEFTHIAQQRSGMVKPTAVMGKNLRFNDDSFLEHEADSFGRKAAKGEMVSQYRSSSLGIRNSLRTLQAKNNIIQRDIKGSKELGNGKLELDFTKNDATAKGGRASETGTIKFTPNKTAPNSNNIRLIQIVRDIDTTGSTEKNYTWTEGEADRNKMMTTSNSSKNIEGGFFIDHSAATADPRTKKSDAVVSPYYRDYWPNASNSQDGHKKSATDIQHASLWDGPGTAGFRKFSFVTSAKGTDTGIWYGTALWGFETYFDVGIVKIKNEYKSFRENRGATTDAALNKFNEFYKNPGTTGAPTK